jgi:hypothetical protein
MPKLMVVPPTEPSPKEKVLQRVKAARPDGTLQCNRCGSRTVLNTENGVTVKNGRRHKGTKIKEDVCADCDARGIYSSMLPVLKPAT